jgi:type IV pilus assembly protein PilA
MLKKMMKMFKKGEKGFSLVELMVVIVIIGVLIAIAIPVYRNTTEKAELRACHANQRMIEGAASQYAMNEGIDIEEVDEIDKLNVYFSDGVPKCPSGAVYSITDGKVTCGEPKHKHYKDSASSTDGNDDQNTPTPYPDEPPDSVLD